MQNKRWAGQQPPAPPYGHIEVRANSRDGKSTSVGWVRLYRPHQKHRKSKEVRAAGGQKKHLLTQNAMHCHSRFVGWVRLYRPHQKNRQYIVMQNNRWAGQQPPAPPYGRIDARVKIRDGKSNQRWVGTAVSPHQKHRQYIVMQNKRWAGQQPPAPPYGHIDVSANIWDGKSNQRRVDTAGSSPPKTSSIQGGAKKRWAGQQPPAPPYGSTEAMRCFGGHSCTVPTKPTIVEPNKKKLKKS